MSEKNTHYQPFAALVVVVIASLACSLLTGPQPAVPPQAGQPQAQAPATEQPAQPFAPTNIPLPTYTPLATYTPEPTYTPGLTNTPVPTNTTVPSEPTLYLDKDYFCREGPTKAYKDVADFQAGLELPIIGKGNTGWWLVKIDVSYTRHKSCWIGGGEVHGDQTQIPYATSDAAVVPVHAPGSWNVIGYLTCAQLDLYTWVPNGVSSGEFESTTKLFKHDHATIVLVEWLPFCPDFSP